MTELAALKRPPYHFAKTKLRYYFLQDFHR